MDEINIESPFMTRIISEILSHQISKKTGRAIGIGIRSLDVVERGGDVYNMRIDCEIAMSKEDLKKLIWKDRIGCGTS